MINRTIHQIWKGGPMPDHLRIFCKEWECSHPEFQYIIWDNDKISREKWVLRELIDNSPNLSMASDMLRYEILLKYGGVYLDTDMYQIRTLDNVVKLHQKLIVARESDLHVHVGFLAAAPGHDIFRECLEEIKKRVWIREKNSSWRSGPGLFTDILENYPDRYELSLHSCMPYDFSYRWNPNPNDKWQKQYPKDKNLIRGQFPDCIMAHCWNYSWEGK